MLKNIVHNHIYLLTYLLTYLLSSRDDSRDHPRDLASDSVIKLRMLERVKPGKLSLGAVELIPGTVLTSLVRTG